MAATTLDDLRRHLARLAPGHEAKAPRERVSFGAAALDADLAGGLAKAALHEIYAGATADIAAATGFSLALAFRAAGGRPILWARQDLLDLEGGQVHAPGLAELGIDPSHLLLARARDPAGVLRMGAEAVRCPALGAVLIEPWGEARGFDLTASRRLVLAAEETGVTVFLLRLAAAPAPSAATSRWQVGPLPSRALEANAPGPPSFALRLLRHRGGVEEGEWRVEWDRDRQIFHDRPAPVVASRLHGSDVASLPRPLVPFPGGRQAHPGGADSGRRRAG